MSPNTTMGERIAHFRKRKKQTQEELGQALGVSNQAVSKWEKNASLPDVMLLPHLARALDVTLDELYGQTPETTAPTRSAADDFPELAYNTLLRLYYDHAGEHFSNCENEPAYWAEQIAKGRMLACLSNTEGGFFLADELAFIDRTYKSAGSETIFTSAEVSRVLRYLSDKTVRRVLAYLYRETVAADKSAYGYFLLPQITEGCSLSSDEAEEALEKLQLLKLVETFTLSPSEPTEYVFLLGNSLYALTLCHLADLMVRDKVWHVVRDTAIISDYAFFQN